jgi:hypothetical protein
LLLFVRLLQVGFRESADGDDAKFEAGFKEGFKRALIHGLEWGRQRGQSIGSAILDEEKFSKKEKDALIKAEKENLREIESRDKPIGINVEDQKLTVQELFERTKDVNEQPTIVQCAEQQ